MGGGRSRASAAPRGTCFPRALVHLPVFCNGAQRGGMNRPESGKAVGEIASRQLSVQEARSSRLKTPFAVFSNPALTYRRKACTRTISHRGAGRTITQLFKNTQ